MKVQSAITILVFFVSLSSSNGFSLQATTHRNSSLKIPPRAAMLVSGSATTTSSGLNMIFLSEASELTTSLNFLQNRDVWVAIAGVFPFAWATVEFWRRIAFGEPFGTGTDSVIIGIDDAPADSRGRRVLGKDALIVAYVLFALAFGSIGIAIYSVISSAPPPDVFPSVQ